MKVLLPILSGVICVGSFLLMLRDAEKQEKTTEITGRIPADTWIFSVFSILLTILIAVFLPKFYPENSIWTDIRCVTLLSVIWPVAYIDFKTLRIPNLFVIYGLVCRIIILVFEIFLGNADVWRNLLSGAIAAAALLLSAIFCALLVKNGIGFGDMKLLALLGLMLGLDGIWSAMLFALLISFVVAVFVLVTRKKTRKDEIPFGPALVLGAYLSICLTGM